MLSLGNAFNDDELRQWEERLTRLVGDDAARAGYSAELKIDGAAVSLTYRDGVLVDRRDARQRHHRRGRHGEHPHAARRAAAAARRRRRPRLIEIRGEVYYPFDRFEQMNEERVQAGEPVFANPRNAAAGALRQLDPADHRDAPAPLLRLLGRRSPAGTSLPFRDAVRGARRARASGAFRSRRITCAASRSTTCTKWAHDVETKIRAELDFAIDGGVVKVDSLALQDELGVVGGREPRWAIARKFAPDIAETRLQRHPGERRSHRNAQSVRGARAGGDRRHDREARDAA